MCTFKHLLNAYDEFMIKSRVEIILCDEAGVKRWFYVMNASLSTILIFFILMSPICVVQHSIYDRLRHNFLTQLRHRQHHNRVASPLAYVTWKMNYSAKNIFFTRTFFSYDMLNCCLLLYWKCILALNHVWCKQKWTRDALKAFVLSPSAVCTQCTICNVNLFYLICVVCHLHCVQNVLALVNEFFMFPSRTVLASWGKKLSS